MASLRRRKWIEDGFRVDPDGENATYLLDFPPTKRHEGMDEKIPGVEAATVGVEYSKTLDQKRFCVGLGDLRALF